MQPNVLIRAIAALAPNSTNAEKAAKLAHKIAELEAKQLALEGELQAADAANVQSELDGSPADAGHAVALRSRVTAIQAALASLRPALVDAQRKAHGDAVSALNADALKAAEVADSNKALAVALLAIASKIASRAGLNGLEITAIWQRIDPSEHPLSGVRVRAAALGLDGRIFGCADAPLPGDDRVQSLLPAIEKGFSRIAGVAPLLGDSEIVKLAKVKAAADFAEAERVKALELQARKAQFLAHLRKEGEAWHITNTPAMGADDGRIYKTGHAVFDLMREKLGASDPAAVLASKWCRNTLSRAVDLGLSHSRSWRSDAQGAVRAIGWEGGIP